MLTLFKVKPKIRQVVFLGGAVGFPAGNVVRAFKIEKGKVSISRCE